MDYQARSMIPYIPASSYDEVATQFLNQYYDEALKSPKKVPIEEIARDGMGLDVRYLCLSEELDIYGMTVFTDGNVEIYDPREELYDTQFFKAKTVLVDSEAVKKTNTGCRNNTIAHECVHWYKHRYYYKRQRYTLPRYARYCKCRVDQVLDLSDDEGIMESQAIGIAPRILMPKEPFIEVAEYLGISDGKDNRDAIWSLADFFDVSRQSATIRLKECNLL